MPFTPNDFTPSAFGAIVAGEANLLATPRTMSELSKDIIAGQAILMHQDPNIVTIGQGLDCMNAKIYTVRSGDTDKGSKTVACTVSTGPYAGTEKIDLTKEVLVNLERFSIDDDQCQNAETFVSLYSYLLLKAKANLEVKLSKGLVALANTNIDTPDATWFETPGNLNGAVFEVAGPQFKSGDVVSDLLWGAKSSFMNDPILLNGRNFFSDSIKAQFESAGCCTNDAILNSNQVFQIYWDSQNVDQVTGAKSSLLIDKNAVLFWSSAGYSNLGMESMMTEGKESGDVYHYVDTLPRLQYFANGQMNPIYCDVRISWGCKKESNNVVPRNSWKVEVILCGAMIANLPNSDGYQGIIRVDNVGGV